MNTAPATCTAGDIQSTKAQIDATWSNTRVEAMSEADVSRKVRLLVFTSLYPNASQPRHGIFVEERLRHLVDSGRIDATVVAPVPWFPFRHRRFGAYSALARVPGREERYGMRVLHPRYPVIPKLGMHIAPFLMYRALLPTVRKLLRQDPAYDLIDAHYLYPDGVAAVALGRRLGKPVVVTARGNDVTLIPRYRFPRRQILQAAAQASAIVTVSKALREQLIELGAADEKISVLRNGVDLDRFRPMETGALRGKLGLTGPSWLAVGHLIERKGVHIVIEALASVPDVTLLIVGDGPEEKNLRSLAKRLDVSGRVRFLGAVPHDALRAYYCVVDTLLLASSREGMPNVVLESLACGTPVVAAPFAGVTELLNAPEAGEVAGARTPEDMASAWRRLEGRRPARAATRRFAERFGWGPVAEAQHALYARVLSTYMRNAGRARA